MIYLLSRPRVSPEEDEEENIPFVWMKAAHSRWAGEGARRMAVLAGEGGGADGQRGGRVGGLIIDEEDFGGKKKKRRLPGGILIPGHERANRHAHAERE